METFATVRKWIELFRRRPLRNAAVLVLIAGLLALVGFAWATMFRSSPDEFWNELAKVGMQFAVVGLLGVLIAHALQSTLQSELAARAVEQQKELAARAEALHLDLQSRAETLQTDLEARAALRLETDALREEVRRRTAYRLELLRRLRSAYGDIKRARRELQTAGFRESSPVAFTPKVVAMYGSAMAQLSDANLELEAILVELRAGLALSSVSSTIESQVGAMERHLGRVVLDEYRRNWLDVQSFPHDLTTKIAPVASRMSGGSVFKETFSNRYHIATCVLIADILMPDPEQSVIERCIDTKGQDLGDRLIR